MRTPDIRDTTHLTVNSKGSNGAAERAVQSVEGLARTLRLDLLCRTNVAVGTDLPITSWILRHAAWLLSHFQAGSGDGKTAYARQFEKPYESPVLPFAERVMWKDPKLQPAKLRSSWEVWFVVETITDKRRAPHLHEIGHRCGPHDLTFADIRTRGVKLSGGHEGTSVAGRPADAAAGDADTVTRHAVEQREVIVVPASSGAPLQVGSGEGVSAPPNPIPNLPEATVARAQSSSAAVESSQHPSGDGVTILVQKTWCLWRWHNVQNRQRSHMLRLKSLAPKRQRGRPATHCWPSPG